MNATELANQAASTAQRALELAEQARRAAEAVAPVAAAAEPFLYLLTIFLLACFVGYEDEESKAAQTAGGYAKQLSAAFYAKQAEVVAAHIAKQDVVICTALVQGRRAPILVTAEMVAAMKPGAVIVDIASDAGGNCALTKPGELFVTENGVKILGYTNWPGRIPAAASALYARNLLTFLSTFWDKDAKAPKLSEEDEIVKGVALTRGGVVVHPQMKPAQAG